MTSRIYIAKVGGGDIELTGFTGRKGTPFFDGDQSLIEMGMRCAMGEASQGTFKVMDPDAEIARADFEYNLPAHKLITWTEDAPGAEIWLARGRTSSYEGGRGLVAVNNQVEFDVTVDDGNVDLRGQAFTAPWERPAEDVEDRLIALQAYTLNGAGSTATNHRDSCEITVDATHLVNIDPGFTSAMPAKTYPVGTQPQDVVADCADTFGYLYSVVIHHTGGSHLCLLHILETDHTTYASPIRISDDLADWDPEHATAPVYEPHWEAGKATIYDGQELVSGLVNIYSSTESVFDQVAGNITAYDYWVDSFYDGQSTTFAQAADRLYGLLAIRSLTQVTHRVSIIMLPEQLDLVAAGMSLEIKAAAAIAGQYLDTWQTRRVAECKFEPRADGRYWAHLELDRAQRRGAYFAGKAQPAATTPQVPGDPIDPTDPGCSPTICELVPSDWQQGTSAFWTDMDSTFTDGAIDAAAVIGEDRVEGIYFQTGGTMFPPLVAGEGQLRGSITLPILDATVDGAEISIILVSPASGSPHGAGLHVLQSQGTGGTPFTSVEVVGQALDANLWVAGGSSKIVYTTPLSGTFKYAIRFCNGTYYVKLWPAGVVEPATWQGPGNTATPDEVRIIVGVLGNNFSDDFTYHFTRPTWCYGDPPAAYYFQWTPATYIETADGTTTTFFLPADPAGGVSALNAFVNGVYEPSSFDSGARTFTLSFAPDEGDIVDAAWIPIP